MHREDVAELGLAVVVDRADAELVELTNREVRDVVVSHERVHRAIEDDCKVAGRSLAHIELIPLYFYLSLRALSPFDAQRRLVGDKVAR